jgi:hypothetical protein
MKFTHLSTTKWRGFKTPKTLGIGFKPQGGVWVSCDDSWKEWNVLNDGPVHAYEYEVELDMSKLIVLKTLKDVRDFSKEFCIPSSEFEEIPAVSGFTPEDWNNMFIRWDRVRDETGKSGIFVKNANIKTARERYPWYSTFDVCSASIWNKDAILRWR